MVRPKSVILSPAEKKAALANLKNQLKEVQNTIKLANGEKKAAQKIFDGVVKTADKAIAVATKQGDSLTAQIAALTAPAE